MGSVMARPGLLVRMLAVPRDRRRPAPLAMLDLLVARRPAQLAAARLKMPQARSDTRPAIAGPPNTSARPRDRAAFLRSASHPAAPSRARPRHAHCAPAASDPRSVRAREQPHAQARRAR